MAHLLASIFVSALSHVPTGWKFIEADTQNSNVNLVTRTVSHTSIDTSMLLIRALMYLPMRRVDSVYYSLHSLSGIHSFYSFQTISPFAPNLWAAIKKESSPSLSSRRLLPPPSTPTLVIKYSSLVLGKKLGEGAYGVVYLGELNKTPVAVKELKGLDKEAHQELMAEVETLM